MPEHLILSGPPNLFFYADKPLPSGGVTDALTLSQLNQRLEEPFEYLNGLHAKQKMLDLTVAAKRNNQKLVLPIKTLSKASFADPSAFVICDMGNVGHGLFANRDFEPGECLLLYAGDVLDDMPHEKLTGDYVFSYRNERDYIVDGSRKGNLSRFVQHMPMNLNSASQEDVALDKNSEGYLSEFWQWRTITYKNELREQDVAWANLTVELVSIDDKPCIVFTNPNKIQKGQQLGVSYGFSYWLARNAKPALFDIFGNVIPDESYAYKEIFHEAELFGYLRKMLPNISVTRPYNAAMFYSDVRRKQEALHPVWFSPFSEPVSLFVLREKLLEFNVIGEEYASIEHQFVTDLGDVLPSDFRIKMYVRDPQQKNKIYDIVCSTENLMSWAQLTFLLKKAPAIINIRNTCLKIVQEILFMDVLGDEAFRQTLLPFLNKVDTEGYFDAYLPEDMIPAGPTRGGDDYMVSKLNSGQKSQILRHHQGMKEAAIDAMYTAMSDAFQNRNSSKVMRSLTEMVSQFSGASTENPQDKELQNVTQRFFSTKPPAKWREYPSSQLKGPYEGHQVRFFTIKNAPESTTDNFMDALKKTGFHVEKKKAGENPSLVVDLTLSKSFSN